MNFVSSSSWRVASQSSMSMSISSISMLLWLAVYLLLFSSCCITTTSANHDEIQIGNNNNLNKNALGDNSNNNDNNEDAHGKPQASDSLTELSEETNDDINNGMEKLTQMKMGNDDNNDDEEKAGNDEDQQLHHSNEQHEQEKEQEQVMAVEEDRRQGDHDHQSMQQHKDEQHQQQGEEEEKYLHEQQEQRMNEGLQEPENSNNEIDGTNASDEEGSNSIDIDSSSSSAAADNASSEDKDNDKETNIEDNKGQTTTSEAYADEIYCSIPDMQVLERMLTGQHDETTTTTTTTSSSETEQRQQSQPPSIFVVLVHKEVDCPKSKEQLSIFRKATSKITSSANKDESVTRLNDDDTTSDGITTGTQYNMIIKNVKFCDIPVRPQTIPLLDQLSVTHAPTIMILKQQKSSSSSLDPESNVQKLLLYGTTYVGSSSTVEELRDGLQHYLSRLEYNKQNWKYQFHPVRKHQEYLSGKLTIRIDSIEELQSIVQQGELFQSVTTPLDPKLSIVEQEWIRFLLQEEEEDNTHPDPYWVICHCTTGNDSNDPTNGLSSEFDALASVLSTRRDVAFCILKEGEGEDCPWIIQSYRIDPQDESMNLQPYSTHNYDMLEDTNYLEAAKVDLRESVSKLIRPTILWLDRQSTAPIAFAPYYKMHAVLFIDFHNPRKTKDITRNTIHEFRSTCRDYHDNEIVCLIVPSTETRILTTFGIDIWSRLDQQFVLKTQYQAEFESSSSSSNNIMMEETPSSSLSSLPTLLITDQRDNVGIKRYYLDPPIKGKINTFFQDVLDGNVKQEIKTSSNKHRYKVNGNNYEIPKNSYNVQLITGDSLIPFLSTSKHTLLMLYAPTCGHCKRLSIAWNALGELVTYLNWSDRLQVGRFDVSSNDFFMKGMSTKYLPEIYYFAPSTKEEEEEEASKSPIRFHSNDIREVGSINDPLDIIDWFLDVLQAENDKNDESDDDNDDVDIFKDPKALLKELQGELE